MIIPKPISFHSWKFPNDLNWDGILPMVRRVYARLIAQDLVPVQPLAAPNFLLHPYFSDIIYQRKKWEPKKPTSWREWVVQKKWEKSGLLDGLRGISNEQGYIYAPYIPIMMTQPINEVLPNQQIVSRYTRRIVNSDFYGTINVANQNRP